MYQYIDDNKEELKNHIKRILNRVRLQLMKRDDVTTDLVKELVVKSFEELNVANIEFFQEMKQILEKLDSVDDEYSIENYLSAPNKTLLYVFDKEFDRKQNRYFEAILAIITAIGKIGTMELNDIKALQTQTSFVNSLHTQVVETAVDMERDMFLDNARKKNITKILWVSERDNKVCDVCKEYDGQVFDVDSVPERPHINCRCELQYSR